MNNRVVAQIRVPNEDKVKRMRDLWVALKQKSLPASTDIGIELQTYLSHAVRIIGIIAGLPHYRQTRAHCSISIASQRRWCCTPSRLGPLACAPQSCRCGRRTEIGKFRSLNDWRYIAISLIDIG